MIQLTEDQRDALTELINIGVGKAAGMLSEMLQAHIRLQVPYLKLFLRSELITELSTFATTPVSTVHLNFKGPFSGTALLAFPQESASNLVSVLASEEQEVSDLDSLRIGALTEVGNIVLSGVMGSISNVLKEHLTYSIPTYMENTIEHLMYLRDHDTDDDPTIVLAHTRFSIELFRIEGDIILLFRLGLPEMLLETLTHC